jgi:hypothetical protein
MSDDRRVDGTANAHPKSCQVLGVLSDAVVLQWCLCKDVWAVHNTHIIITTCLPVNVRVTGRGDPGGFNSHLNSQLISSTMSVESTASAGVTLVDPRRGRGPQSTLSRPCHRFANICRCMETVDVLTCVFFFSFSFLLTCVFRRVPGVEQVSDR